MWYALKHERKKRDIRHQTSVEASTPLLVLVPLLETGHVQESLNVIIMCTKLGILRIVSFRIA